MGLHVKKNVWFSIWVWIVVISSCCIQQTDAFQTGSILHRPQRISQTQPQQQQQQTNNVLSVRQREINNNRSHLQQRFVSPSGIDELPNMYQASVFIGIYGMLTLATIPTIKSIDALSNTMGLERWRNMFVDTSLPLLLGLFYLSAGIGHFASADSFRDIYPPIGTWGIWYLPGSATFHVAWTGIVEALGGGGLLYGAIRNILGMEEDDDDTTISKLVLPLSALALFALTIVVTPANIYMYTHGATMGDMGPLDLSFHYIRFVVQVLILGLLFAIAKDSFFFAWGDELD